MRYEQIWSRNYTWAQPTAQGTGLQRRRRTSAKTSNGTALNASSLPTMLEFLPFLTVVAFFLDAGSSSESLSMRAILAGAAASRRVASAQVSEGEQLRNTYKNVPLPLGFPCALVLTGVGASSESLLAASSSGA